jgi:hypothetical protein
MWGRKGYHFTGNYDSHNKPTWSSKNFHLLAASLSIFQQDVQYSGVKLFTKLALELKQIAKYPNKFKSSLKNYLVGRSFYSLDELTLYRFTKGCVTYSIYSGCKRPVLDPFEYNNKSNRSNQIYVKLLFRANVFIV